MFMQGERKVAGGGGRQPRPGGAPVRPSHSAITRAMSNTIGRGSGGQQLATASRQHPHAWTDPCF